VIRFIFLLERCSVVKIISLAAVAFIFMLLSPAPNFAQTAPVSIALTPSVASPQMLGTSIVWTATVVNPVPGDTYDYQFAISINGNIQVVRDAGVANTFTWVPYTVEGLYWVVVRVRDITLPTRIVYPYVAAIYQIMPWVTTAGGSAVNPTANPLVALFSGPPCIPGHFLLVRFQKVTDTVSSTTNSVPCSQFSANFYVAGMLPLTQYLMHWEEFGPGFAGSVGPNLTFTTGTLPASFPTLNFNVNVPPTPNDALYPFVFFHLFAVYPNVIWPVATDLSGNIAWFFPGPLFITRVEPGGNFFSMTNQVLSEFDLAGNEILETNTSILNEQLTAQGYPTMTSFNNHETRRLPNGNILILGARDVSSTSAQGGTPTAPVDIIGDMVLILDHNMQLLWAWDSFAHQDITRAATLGDICLQGSGGCPAFSSTFTQANDWLHTNFAQVTADGNIILSERSQDWVVKINYSNGAGDGSVLWRLGAFGDFNILNPPSVTCGDPNVFPWFTHQHDAAIEFESNTDATGIKIMTVFDDGNLRYSQCGNTGNSRGLVLFMGEAARSIYVQTSADLGGYSFAVGSSQLLINGSSVTASYDNGLQGSPAPFSQATEVDLGGNIVYQLQADHWSYRTYRMQNLYTPTIP
jgi:arylsulfate sulfotransferase